MPDYGFIVHLAAEKVKRFCGQDERQTAAEIKTRTEQADPCNHYPAERVALSGSLSLYPKPGILSIEIRKKQEFPDFGGDVPGKRRREIPECGDDVPGSSMKKSPKAGMNRSLRARIRPGEIPKSGER